MKRQIAIYFFTLMATLLVSCMDTGTEPSKIVFRNVEGYEKFFVPGAGTAVIKDDSTWLRYWRDYWNVYSDTGKVPPPTIDFNKAMVVAVFYGAKYGGCSNKVEVIKDVRLDKNYIRVQLGSLPFLGLCRRVVAPIQMVEIPKSTRQVVFAGNVPQ